MAAPHRGDGSKAGAEASIASVTFFAMALPVALMLVLQIGLPAYFTYGVWRGREASRALWGLRVGYSGAYVAFVFLAGRWDWLSMYLRFVVGAIFVVAAIAGYRQMREIPWLINGRPGTWWTTASALIALATMLTMIVLTVRGFRSRETPVHLELPLRDGAYYVGQGGSRSVVNYHRATRAQQYALDIVQLNALGARASRIYSTDLEHYEIFGREVYSPCDGTVVEVVDGLPDHPPPQRDVTHPAGNHIVIACRGVRVELAHLENGSVRASRGSHVPAGHPIASVGNSGNTSEPHLHIHAVRGGDAGGQTGDGVPMLFDGVFPVRNTTLRR